MNRDSKKFTVTYIQRDTGMHLNCTVTVSPGYWKMQPQPKKMFMIILTKAHITKAFKLLFLRMKKVNISNT